MSSPAECRYAEELEWVAETHCPAVRELCERYLNQLSGDAEVDIYELAFQVNVYLNRQELESIVDRPTDSRLFLE